MHVHQLKSYHERFNQFTNLRQDFTSAYFSVTPTKLGMEANTKLKDRTIKSLK